MEYEYHFPVFNLYVSQPFQIGNTYFHMFTKTFFDNLYEKYKSKGSQITPVDFDGLYRKEYENSVIAMVKSSLERNVAESIVKREAEKSVDVLKIICLGPFADDANHSFDLNYRLNYQMLSGFLTRPENDFALLINKNFENHRPFSLNTQAMYQNQSGCIARFSDFITFNKTDELYNLILNGIGMYSSALSTRDLHLRIVSMITVLESLLLKDEEEYKTSIKTKCRLAKLIPGTPKEKQNLKDLFERIYQIRHKMVHKAIRLPIEINDLTEAQRCVIEMFFYLMKMNYDGMTEKKQLISSLDNMS